MSSDNNAASIETAEHDVNATIWETISAMLHKLDVPYAPQPFDHEFHELCVKQAIERGYPMSDITMRRSIRLGVSYASNAYAHTEEKTQVFIALYTAVLTYMDDAYANSTSDALRMFPKHLSLGERPADPILNILSEILQEIPEHYDGPVSGIILASSLDFINSMILESEVNGMTILPSATKYSEFARRLSGVPSGYAVMIFAGISIKSYIQCLPEMGDFINYINDVLSFYKEEKQGETHNYISTYAENKGISKLEALKSLANDVLALDGHVCSILRQTHPEALEMWNKFKTGYLKFHFCFGRYLLHELAN